MQGPRKTRTRPAQGLRKTRARPAQDPRKARARPRPRPVLKKTSVSQMIDLVMTIQTVQELSKSELSSRFLSTSKFGPPRKTSAQGHARLFAQGQGWLIFSINYCTSYNPNNWDRPRTRLCKAHDAWFRAMLHFWALCWLHTEMPDLAKPSNGKKIARIAPILTIF